MDARQLEAERGAGRDGHRTGGAYLTDPEQAFQQLRTVVQNAIDVRVYVLVDWHDHAAHEHLEQSVDFFTRIAAEFRLSWLYDAGLPIFLALRDQAGAEQTLR